MKQLDVTDEVHEQVRLLARAWNVPEGEAVRRLIDRFRDAGGAPAVSNADPMDVPVHAVYAGVRTGGLYDKATRSLKITTGPLAGREFKSPSGAAVALVAQLSPGVNPNRNGWSFWTVTATGEWLQSQRNAPTRS